MVGFGGWMDVEMFFGFFAGNWGETFRKDIWENGWMLKFDFFSWGKRDGC